MSAAMAHNAQAFSVLGGDDLDFGIAFYGSDKVNDLVAQS